MTEDNKYNLYVMKSSVKDIEFLEKADKAVLISGIVLYIIPFIFIDLEKIVNVGIIALFFVFYLLYIINNFRVKRTLILDGEIKLIMKRKDFYFYKNEELALKLLDNYINTKYRKTLFNNLKLIINAHEKIFEFYLKMDSEYQECEKLYSDMKTKKFQKSSFIREYAKLICFAMLGIYIIISVILSK
ncbi:hypothetical protein [Sebaldella sp. S0638]|uniref:hypothetical protein n=1 Tax=Sebaldella sp. S0638 TaxID=2957809 RepID=UPI00209EE12A|nr:hypothetical protein [Sebaldella sp. S0638]MCP1223809.1 hypothetical protein [Sebaldella sp. S0638]